MAVLDISTNGTIINLSASAANIRNDKTISSPVPISNSATIINIGDPGNK